MEAHDPAPRAGPARIVVVVPAKNEAGNLKILFGRYRDLGLPYEVVVIDGHSADDTRAVAGAHGIRVIEDEGKGKGSAIRHAINQLDADILVFMDADNSHDCGEIPRLVQPILDGRADHVSGSRVLGGSDEMFGDFNNFLRAVGNYVIATGISLRFGQRLSDAENGFRAIRTDVARKLGLRENIHTIEQEMIIKTLRQGYRLVEVPTHEYARLHGASSIRLRKVAWRFVYTWLRDMYLH
ncbi:MAG TPA: glycosyltransferase family 2 protein [Vicinamibacterales bacterium]|jgi:glycosyltransferase involved in cell wall biosynthesis|nr:glycosyltransferase family 2 protein [Vicinamibacterales bacterium]